MIGLFGFVHSNNLTVLLSQAPSMKIKVKSGVPVKSETGFTPDVSLLTVISSIGTFPIFKEAYGCIYVFLVHCRKENNNMFNFFIIFIISHGRVNKHFFLEFAVIIHT